MAVHDPDCEKHLLICPCPGDCLGLQCLPSCGSLGQTRTGFLDARSCACWGQARDYQLQQSCCDWIEAGACKCGGMRSHAGKPGNAAVKHLPHASAWLVGLTRSITVRCVDTSTSSRPPPISLGSRTVYSSWLKPICTQYVLGAHLRCQARPALQWERQELRGLLACCRNEYRLTSASCPSAKTRALPNLRAHIPTQCSRSDALVRQPLKNLGCMTLGSVIVRYISRAVGERMPRLAGASQRRAALAPGGDFEHDAGGRPGRAQRPGEPVHELGLRAGQPPLAAGADAQCRSAAAAGPHRARRLLHAQTLW